MAGQETAQFQMGEMYFLGIGVKQNCEEAKRLFMKTAQKGYLFSLSVFSLLSVTFFLVLAVLFFLFGAGTWGKIVDTAFESFQNKKYDIALLDYMHGAEQGYEVKYPLRCVHGVRKCLDPLVTLSCMIPQVAQLNVGYMLERDLGTSIIVGNSSLNQEGRERRRYDVALSYFVRAARNGNIKANLKVFLPFSCVEEFLYVLPRFFHFFCDVVRVLCLDCCSIPGGRFPLLRSRTPISFPSGSR